MCGPDCPRFFVANPGSSGMSSSLRSVFYARRGGCTERFRSERRLSTRLRPQPFWRGPVSTALSTVPRAPSPSFPRSLTPVVAPPARASGVLPVGGITPLISKPVLPPPAPAAPPLPRSTAERMVIARERIRVAAEAGQRVRSYEVALDVDLSEFHFARQFRAAFGRSPHVFYDEVRAEKARALLAEGMSEGEVARRVGFRRPAELRALRSKRTEPKPGRTRAGRAPEPR